MNTHEITLKDYSAYSAEGILSLGVAGSYGTETLNLTREEPWANYDIVATFHPAKRNAAAVQVQCEGDQLTVPAEAMAAQGIGKITFAGYVDGVRQVASDILFRVLSSAGCDGNTPETNDMMQQILNAVKNVESIAEGVRDDASRLTNAQRKPVYCWGDSLTQGIGGNVNGWHLISYPQVLSERCSAVNLGILSDNVPTIQARQGSLKIILPVCTIPASASEYVEIGNVEDGLPLEDGTTAYLLKYGDAGLNPCYVNDVPCILFRDYKSDTIAGTKFRLRRLEDGEAVTVSKNTALVPYSAKHYKGGIHIFWMGANGGYGNKTDGGTDLAFSDYVARLQACVKAAKADDYLIIYARERVGYTQNEAGEKKVLAQTFAGHFIDLVPQLCDRGLLYGETSLWDGTLKNGVPSVLDSGDGCHYSFYGYKAIANIVWEYLWPKLAASKSSSDDQATGDDFGTWAYKLPAALTFTAAMSPIDTGFRPFGIATGDFTIAVRFSRNAQPNNGTIRVIWMQEWFTVEEQSKALAMCIYNDADGFTMPKLYLFEASGGFLVDPESMSITLPESAYHTIIIARNGSKYYNYIDGTLIYGGPLDYTAGDLVSSATLTVGGAGTENNFIGELNDVRIYDKYLEPTQCAALYQAMNKEEK